MSVWNWIHAFLKRVENDPQRLDLYFRFNDALECREADPGRTMAMLQEGRHIARDLDEPWWDLFFEHWALQTLLFYSHDYTQVVDRAVKATIEATKPTFRDFPQRVCLHEDLIYSYVGIDPDGYAPKIEQALDYMRREVHPNLECNHCLIGCRTAFELNREKFDVAQESAEKELELAEQKSSDHYAGEALRTLCQLGDAPQGLRDDARTRPGRRETHRARLEREGQTAEFLVYQTIAWTTMEETRHAQRCYGKAIPKIKGLAVPNEELYETLITYQEVLGDREKALRFRDRQWQIHGNRGKLLTDVRILRERCRQLKELGRLTDADVEQAKTAIRKLRHPEPQLQRLSLIAR
ncbi:MAG: hypothetical protein U0744_04070 [Gemmataceae bacterium]